jgi:hypothetical protein
MPGGFVPNATAASQSSSLVAVISYSSPKIQIIDASNVSTDLANNTIVNTFTAPITEKVTFNGITCMICAALVNPLNNQLLLSTAQGYYSMDLTSGAFTALPLTPAILPSPDFTLNPLGQDPYILSPTFGQGPSTVQAVNLATNKVTNDTNFGVTTPTEVAIDLQTSYGAVVDGSASDQSLLDLVDIQNPTSGVISPITVCPGDAKGFNMVALGVSASVNNPSHTLFLGQTAGNCVGFETFPQVGAALSAGFINYGYGSLPPTPEGAAFATESDLNAIAVFNSVVDKSSYAVLVDSNQNWIAKLNLGTLANSTEPLPTGSDISSLLTTGAAGDPVVYLPTPSTIGILSQYDALFGNQNVGTASLQVPITFTNISTNPVANLQVSSIKIEGPNAGDFAESDDCVGFQLLSEAQCTIVVTFTPTSAGAFSAGLSITDNGGTVTYPGVCPGVEDSGNHFICLTGTGVAAAQPDTR